MLLVRSFRPDFSCNLLVWIQSISNDKSKRWRTIPFVDQRWEWCPGRLSDRIHPLHSVQLIACASHLGLLPTWKSKSKSNSELGLPLCDIIEKSGEGSLSNYLALRSECLTLNSEEFKSPAWTRTWYSENIEDLWGSVFYWWQRMQLGTSLADSLARRHDRQYEYPEVGTSDRIPIFLYYDSYRTKQQLSEYRTNISIGLHYRTNNIGLSIVL